MPKNFKIDSSQAESIRKAQTAAILKRLQAGKTITAAQQAFLDAQTEQPKEPAVKEKLYSVNALANLLDHDRRTVTKAVLKIQPAREVGGKRLYRLADVQAALASKPDKTLKDELLIEQIRRARNRNDRDEEKVLAKEIVRRLVNHFMGEASKILSQKLEAELPSLVSGLDVVGIRTKGAQINDEVRAELRKLVEAWPE